MQAREPPCRTSLHESDLKQSLAHIGPSVLIMNSQPPHAACSAQLAATAEVQSLKA